MLRLLHGLGQDTLAVYTTGQGDSAWYLAQGYALVTGLDETALPGYGAEGSLPVSLRHLPTPPLYLLLIGFWQALLPRAAAILAIYITQALLSTLTVYFAYRITAQIGSHRAGLIAAGLLAIAPVFIIETGLILTETLYIFLLALAFWLYLLASHSRWWERGLRGEGALMLAAFVFGLATLTRAALLLFPLGLALHLLLANGWRQGLRRAGLLLLIYSLTVATWTMYSLARWDRFVIAGEGFAAFLYIGATDTGWQGPEATDAALLEPGSFEQEAQAIISADPLGYIQRRIGQLTAAYLQPHGTVFYSGESLRQLVANWFETDRTFTGLIELTQGQHFWPKLAIYIFHYGVILLGLAGMWCTRHRWRLTLPLIGLVLYVTLLHLLLDAIPRYIFPTMLVWVIFAALALGGSVLQSAADRDDTGADRQREQ